MVQTNDSIRTVLELPISDAGCGKTRIVASSTQLDAEYQFFSDQAKTDLVGTLRFGGVIAYRFRDEMHSLGFVKKSYDSLVEILGSAWKRELERIEPTGIWGAADAKRHFAIFFSSNGYLEVLAEDVEELPARCGVLTP